MLSQQTEHKIEEMIATNSLVPAPELEAAKVEAVKVGKTLIEILVERKLITDTDSTKLIALAGGTPYADFTGTNIGEDILQLIPREVAEMYMAVPFALKNGHLQVAMVDPSNLQAIDFIARKTGYPVNAFMSSAEQIQGVLSTYTSGLGAGVEQALGTAANVSDNKTEESAGAAAGATKQAGAFGSSGSLKETGKQVETIIQDAPITRALNTIVEYAINSKASDVHIEPREKDLRIRFRIDGILQEAMTLPKTTEAALVSRIKILSNLKIDEHRIPQDGEAQYKVAGREVDMRIAIAPTAFGEQVVIRILDKSDSLMSLAKLGFAGRSYRLIQEGMKKPHGMILSTGPTGSGKSTTLYAVIQEIKSVEVNIVTLEDPIEYKMSDINQIQVNAAVGLTFASGLRSILRQDPNVIMVGEIRDHETADLAVQAALTCHTVLATLHTNSASGVLPRLLDMQIEPFLIGSTVNTVIGQRLVRKVCDNCRQQVVANEAMVDYINRVAGSILPKDEAGKVEAEKDLGYKDLPLSGQTAYTLYKGAGCSQCSDGYKGRTGIYEVFAINEAMEKLLLDRATTTAIQDQAMKDGMLTMQQDGVLKALLGITTLEEVTRVASDY